MWCMLAINSKSPLGDWLRSLPDYMPGNRQDNVNSLVTVLPPYELLNGLAEGKAVYLPTTIPDGVDETLYYVLTIGKTLSLDDDDTIIIGHKYQWEMAYNTPHWRIWCAPYFYDSDTDEGYVADLVALGMPTTLTREQARVALKQYIVEA